MSDDGKVGRRSFLGGLAALFGFGGRSATSDPVPPLPVASHPTEQWFPGKESDFVLPYLGSIQSISASGFGSIADLAGIPSPDVGPLYPHRDDDGDDEDWCDEEGDFF